MLKVNLLLVFLENRADLTKLFWHSYKTTFMEENRIKLWAFFILFFIEFKF